MKSFEEYGLEDFAANDDFIRWCLRPTPEDEIFWSEFLGSRPDKKEIILEARQLVIDLNMIETEENESNFESEIWKKIDENISPSKHTKFSFKRNHLLKIAAAVLILLISPFVIQQVFEDK